MEAGTVSLTLPRDTSAEKDPVSNDVIELPVASSSVAVILRRKVRVSSGLRRPLADVERMSVMESEVEEKRVGTSGTAGTPAAREGERNIIW